MAGLIMTIIIWSGFAFAIRNLPLGRRLKSLSVGLGREHLALILLLLATHSFGSTRTADAALADPFTIEVLARGVLNVLAMFIVAPMFVKRFRLAPSVRMRYFGMLLFSLYGIVAVLSITWSVAPLVTMGKAFEIGVAIMLFWVFLLRRDAKDVLLRTIEFVLMLEAALLVVALLGFFLMPSVFALELSRTGFFFRETMAAPFGGPNGFSAMGATITAFALARYFYAPRSERTFYFALMVIGTLGNSFSSGKQGVLIWFVSMSILLLMHRRQLFVLFIVPVFGAFVALNSQALWETFTRNQVSGALATGSGRLDLWASGLRSFAIEPITGYGFGAGSRFVALENIGASEMSHVHNGYLESVLGVGLLGWIPFMFAVVRVSIWAARSLHRRIDVPFAILIVPLLIQNFLGQGFGAWLNTRFILFVLLVALSDEIGIGKRPRIPSRATLVAPT